MPISLLPASAAVLTARTGTLPLYRDVLWEDGTPVYRNGVPIVTTGLEALRGWIWRALETVRYELPIHTNAYGCELDTLIGRPYSDAVKTSEARRMVSDALTCNPYIRAVRDVHTSLDCSTVQITCTVDTIYGEVQVYV